MNLTSAAFRLIAFSACFFLLSINNLYAQKFGKIDKERLQEKQHPLDPDASFAYIFKNCETSYDLQSRSPRLITLYHYRIKIYDDEGVDQANIVRYLYRNKRNREDIKGIKAECHNWVDGKDEKTKLSKKEIFKEELDENITKVSFAIPNARAGSIIEFRFRIVSPFLYSTPRHYFQEDVPVDYSNFKIDVPGYFTMAPSATGSIPLNKREEEKYVFGTNVSQFVFEVSDVPAIEDDKYVLDINDYRSSLKYELSVVDFPGSKAQNFTKDWNSICKNLMKSDYFGKAIKMKVKPAEDLISEIKSLEEGDKLIKIVDFINTNIVWDKNVGKYGAESYNDLFREKSGNAAEINLLLINLCKKAGLEAYPVLTKYRFHGMFNTIYPSLTEINYVFAMIEVDGSPLFVDATSPYFEPGTLPLRALNIQGILIKDEANQIIELKNTNMNYHRKVGKYTLNIEEGRLDGTGAYKMKQYASVMARKKAVEENEDEDQQDLIKELDEGNEEDED
ncbi:MAG: DUF3857 domain-containing protein, partial [Saprospiraceae bacterium]|nr:DUF3857 domain-containing protein [Saprospiraceae bacterium]